jgi:hypothetical protein
MPKISKPAIAANSKKHSRFVFFKAAFILVSYYSAFVYKRLSVNRG